MCPVTCNCSKCPVKGTFKCPKKELEDRAYYFKTLLDQERKKQAGRAGGMATSAAKAAAARANGKLGGRPRKRPKATS